MTPEEKAEQLYNLFLPLVKFSDLYDTYHNKAKNSALICVDEVELQAYNWGVVSVRRYWEKVKEEIEKL